ncbi:6-phosphogluconolactonase [Palleronia caenipelagi]|uniref:6-phosphogluconolactonase n=1 Tax=Palleronia caenipelagi TaxID=2489174 RepID=A0A547PXJ0_9RHOB|nr:6-phosphogluconolactonase [Palleronia caenipelagi]TRD18871.1 6-phosphogluconolactonase [Palleronia caenipelagi]
MKFIEYPDSDMMMMDLADQLAGELTNALLTHDQVSMAVPGGSTPGPAFDSLSGADLPWERVHVMLTDERKVPATHERSNERLLRSRLFQDKAAAAQFVRLVPEDGVDMGMLGRRIAPHLPLSILLIGMGADMHCASLFPGAPQLDAALAPHAPPVMEVDASEGLEPRVTLTAPVLKGALSTHILIKGPEKREALEKARHLSPKEAPIALVLKNATVHWSKD